MACERTIYEINVKLTWEITIRDDLGFVCDESAQIIYAGHETEERRQQKGSVQMKCQAPWHSHDSWNIVIFPS